MRLSLLFHLACLALLLFPSVSLAQAGVDNLRTEYLDRPLGLDVAAPRFTWQLTAAAGARGISQQAYRLQVSAPSGEVVWDTGRVGSGQSVLVPYGGTSLQPKTRYAWEVTAWDQDMKPHRQTSWFETGLLDPDPDSEAWQGAQWLGGGDGDLPFNAHALSVFRLSYTLQLDRGTGSRRAAFVLGANDMRLLRRDYNIQGVETARNGHYLAVELDISALDAGGQARLHLYRVGYAPADSPDIPFKSFDIPEALVNSANRYAPHRVNLTSTFGMIRVFLDGNQAENEITQSESDSPFAPRGVNVNPVGRGQDYISFPLLADIGFRLPPGQAATFSQYEVRYTREPSNVLFSEHPAGVQAYDGIFADRLAPQVQHLPAGLRLSGGEQGLLLTADPSRNAAPMLRTSFRVADKPVAGARLYVTARGIYEMYLNGSRVGHAWFTPGLTQYNRHQQYQTYDLSDQLRPGAENVLGGWLGEGWWSGNITYSGDNWNYFGDRQSLRALLEITYEDGTQTVVATNPDAWKLYTEGPIRSGSFFQGEVYDARREAALGNWSEPGYDDSAWKPAAAVPLEGTTFPGLSFSNQQLIGQIGLPPSHVATLKARGVEEVRPGIFVYDMGQNMVGVPRISIRDGRAGDTLVLRYAEVRYPDLPAYKGNEGMIMLENIRAALTQDLVILKGGDQTVEPRFTFHGYRYLELSGLDQPPAPEAVEGLVISSIDRLDSEYETSDPLINRFWENITWSLRANFLSIPTDTPARNERMGWSGDINVFSQAATYLAGVAPFLARHMLAMRDIQREDGRFTDVAPVGGGFGGTLWGSAGIIVPWEVYQQYGDVRVLDEHYEAMARYLAFLDSRVDPASGRIDEGPLGDWLSPENAKNDNTLLWTAYHAYDLWILSETARLLGKDAEAARYLERFQERKAYFNRTYVDAKTGRTVHSGYAGRMFGPPPPGYTAPRAGDWVDTQASYAIPLNFGIFNPEHEAAAARHLAEAVQRQNRDDSGVLRPAYSLMTGFIGTASINPALSKTGNDTDAYRLLRQREYPSWLYPVINGATTIWERLNSYTNEDGFGGNNSMNSFNHYSFGAVGAWMYNYSLGIRRDSASPGFRHFRLEPVPDPEKGLTFARGYYDSPYGRIASGWEFEGEATLFRFTVPPNTTATLRLPAKRVKQVTEGGHRLRKVPGISQLSESGEKVQLELASGTYEFRVE